MSRMTAVTLLQENLVKSAVLHDRNIKSNNVIESMPLGLMFEYMNLYKKLRHGLERKAFKKFVNI